MLVIPLLERQIEEEPWGCLANLSSSVRELYIQGESLSPKVRWREVKQDTDADL